LSYNLDAWVISFFTYFNQYLLNLQFEQPKYYSAIQTKNNHKQSSTIVGIGETYGPDRVLTNMKLEEIDVIMAMGPTKSILTITIVG
jgi:hypothetical protein